MTYVKKTSKFKLNSNFLITVGALLSAHPEKVLHKCLLHCIKLKLRRRLINMKRLYSGELNGLDLNPQRDRS